MATRRAWSRPICSGPRDQQDWDWVIKDHYHRSQHSRLMAFEMRDAIGALTETCSRAVMSDGTFLEKRAELVRP